MGIWKPRTRAGVVALSTVVVAGLLAACGDSGTSGGEGADGDSITFGVVTPLSAPGDVQAGNLMVDTARLWAETQNADGGIDGKKVKVEVADDGGLPAKGVSGMTQLIVDKKACCIMGMWQSSVTLAQTDVAKRYNVPMGVNFSFNDDITKRNYPQVFRLGPYDSRIAEMFVPFMQDAGYKDVSIIYESTSYGQGTEQALKSALGAAGGFNVTTTQYDYETRDLTPELSKIATSPPDALIVAGSTTSAYLAFNQAKEVGLDSAMVAAWDFPVLPDFWKTVGKNGVGAIYPTFFADSIELTEEGKRFQSLFTDEYGSSPTIALFYLWNVMNAYKSAIEKAGSSDPAEIVKQIPSLDFEGTTGTVTLQSKKGTVDFNQWTDFQMFFKQMTAEGQDDAEAKLIYSTEAQ